MSKLIIHCPTQGSPYIVKNKKEELEDLQELVGFPNYEEQSLVEEVNNKNWIIDPMFCEENKNWNLAEECRKIKSTTYVNEEGIPRNYCVNMACININSRNPLFGEVFICISKKKYDKICEKLNHKLKEFDFNEDISSEEEEDADAEE